MVPRLDSRKKCSKTKPGCPGCPAFVGCRDLGFSTNPQRHGLMTATRTKPASKVVECAALGIVIFPANPA
jgi:hypothetical protein